jgi:DNA invertase Pin-like site-specific DNA recombinase
VVGFMVETVELGVGLYLHRQAVDASTPARRAMVSMCGVLVEFECAMMVERVKLGLARARWEGKQLGRPRVSPETEERTKQMQSYGMGVLRIAREAGVNVSVLQRVVA